MNSSQSASSAEHPYIWYVAELDPEIIDRFRTDLGVKNLVAYALAAMGFTTSDEAKHFLEADLSQLHSPWLLPDIEVAVNLLCEAKENGETIFLHGDYDADGITSTTLFYKFLTKIGCKVIPHVPHRINEGYGIAIEKVDDAAKLGAKLFLTCDCGGGAFEQIKLAKQMGMKVVVTDHHQVTQHPEADAFVNPHRDDSKYPFNGICGVAVVFKVCQAMVERLNLPVQSFQNAYLDLVTIGTVADVMPIVDENRILVKHGLPLLTNTKKPGLIALFEQANIQKSLAKGLSSKDIGFAIGPRLNAPGRIDDAGVSLELMLADSLETAVPIAQKIEQLNTDRKAQTDSILEEAIELAIQTGQTDDELIIVCGENWHPGIVGIVAGRLREAFNRPAFALTFSAAGRVFSGSGRSIDAFDLSRMIYDHSGLIAGGGHKKAAGISIDLERFQEAYETLKAYAKEKLAGLDLRPTIYIAKEITFDEFDLVSAKQLRNLEPFGEGNYSPRFLSRGVIIESIKFTRNPDHPQILIRQGESKTETFAAFYFGKLVENWNCPFTADIVYEIGVGEWNGAEKVEKFLKDIQICQ